MIIKSCELCSKKFNTRTSETKRGKGRFCSRKCVSAWREQNFRGSSNSNWKGGKIKKICNYCKKEYYTKPSRRLSSKYCSKKCVSEWMSANMRKEKHPSWKGGLTEINWSLRLTSEYLEWKKKVYKRDSYTCQICGKTKIEVHANHIKKFSEHPELRTNMGNGITLCKDCHIHKVNSHELEWEDYFINNLKKRNYI